MVGNFIHAVEVNELESPLAVLEKAAEAHTSPRADHYDA
jgi:hypothetical protein